MAFAAAAQLPRQRKPLLSFGQHQLDWILGQNPFNACMLAGHGSNNPAYTAGYPNALGICNGITAGFDDEAEIAFIPEAYKDRLDQNWRWGEQWIPTPPGLLWPSLGRMRREMEVDMIEFWVGVDGGGTHTRARIRDRAGKLLGEGAPPAPIWSSASRSLTATCWPPSNRPVSRPGWLRMLSNGWVSGWRSPPPSWPTAITPC